VIHTLLQSRKSYQSVVLEVHESMIKKAAPRFELGVEVLQTSALPRGILAIQAF